MHGYEISHHAFLVDAKTSKKQLQCSNALKLYLANLFTSCLDSMVESEKILFKAIKMKGSHGRTKKKEGLRRRMADSDYLHYKDKQTSTQTMTRWINECVAIGRKENACLDAIQDLEGIHRKTFLPPAF